MQQQDRTEDHCRTVADEGPKPFQDAVEQKVNADRESPDNALPQGIVLEKPEPHPGIVTVHDEGAGQPELGNADHDLRVGDKDDHQRETENIICPDKLFVKSPSHSVSGKISSPFFNLVLMYKKCQCL
jgi:hypothetical protein